MASCVRAGSVMQECSPLTVHEDQGETTNNLHLLRHPTAHGGSTGAACPARLRAEQANLQTAVASMTREEEDCLKQLSDLLNSDMSLHWEGVEIGRYWQELGKKLLLEKLYKQ
eukprot:750362-Hanusia_phi.AAC.2